MTSRTLLFALLVLKLVVNYAYSGCVTGETSALCDNITEASANYFEVAVQKLRQVHKLTIRNNNSKLSIRQNAFKDFANLERLFIEDCQVQKLYIDTFKDLPLKTLYINDDGIEEIIPGAFNNLPKLKTFHATGNRLITIPRGVFKDLPKLATLSLSKNEITTIEDSALEDLPHLQKLHLDHNEIETIFVHKIVSHPEQLQILWLHNNSLKLVSNFMLQKLRKLRLLNLGFNKISLIEPNAFEQTPALETLVLTHNKLKQVDGSIFPREGLNLLGKLYLDNNELMFLSSNFFFRLNNLKKITLVGNPWWCPCLDIIQRILSENNIIEKCQNKYVDGQRPICVSEDATSKVCSYEYNEVMSEKYMDYKKNYPLYVNAISCIL